MIRITPENITEVGDDEIFVFGSNEAGVHLAGAAIFAKDDCGARLFQGFGPWGRSFGIPTKDWEIKQLSLDAIHGYVKRFIEFTKIPDFHDAKFYVTAIGCGLAGYTPEDIAPMFRECLELENVWLPKSFIQVLDDKLILDYDGADLNL